MDAAAWRRGCRVVIGFTWSRLRSIGSMRFPDDGQEELFVHTAGEDGFLLMR